VFEKLSLLGITVLTFVSMLSVMGGQKNLNKGIQDVVSHNYLYKLEAKKLTRVNSLRSRK
jgi:hypothetical protein